MHWYVNVYLKNELMQIIIIFLSFIMCLPEY